MSKILHLKSRRINGQKSITFKEIITALLSLRPSSREEGELERDEISFNHAVTIFLGYLWGWKASGVLSGMYWVQHDDPSVFCFTNNYVSTFCRWELPGHGSALQFLLHFHLRALSLVVEAENQETKTPVAHGLRSVRQSGLFLCSEFQQAKCLLFEERKTVALYVRINGSRASQYSVVVLGGKEGSGDYGIGIPAVGPLTGVSIFVSQLKRIFSECLTSWSMVLDKLDQQIGAPVSATSKTFHPLSNNRL